MRSKPDILDALHTMPAQTPVPGEARAIIERHIKLAIESGELPPGTRVKQQQIADIFNTSRMPVREALRMLEVQGYLENFPQRGYLVSTTFPGAQSLSLDQKLEEVTLEYLKLTTDDQRLAFENQVIEILHAAL